MAPDIQFETKFYDRHGRAPKRIEGAEMVEIVAPDGMDRLTDLYHAGGFAPTHEVIAKGRHAGFEYFIAWYRNHPNAYIKIPEGHPFYRKFYTDIDDKNAVHGGFTFSDENLNKAYELKDGWYLGWDYAHARDFISDEYLNDGHVWTIKEIKAECERVIDKVIKQ